MGTIGDYQLDVGRRNLPLRLVDGTRKEKRDGKPITGLAPSGSSPVMPFN